MISQVILRINIQKILHFHCHENEKLFIPKKENIYIIKIHKSNKQNKYCITLQIHYKTFHYFIHYFTYFIFMLY